MEKQEVSMTNSDKFLVGLESVIQGFRIAEQIVSKDLTVHYLIMNKHIGDVFHQLQYVAAFKRFYEKDGECISGDKSLKKIYVVKKIVIVTNSVNAGIAKLFSSVDEIVILNNEDLFNIGMYAKSMICVHKNLHRDDNGHNMGYGWEPGTGYKTRLHNFKSYRWWLDLPSDLGDLQEWRNNWYRIRDESLSTAKEILKNLNIKAENVVILCPYAQSSSSLSYEEISLFIHYLHEQGYWVFSNVGAKEKELTDTLRLQVPVDVFVALGMLGATIIGVQSGIIDVVREIQRDIKIIDIHYLKTPKDISYAQGIKIKNSVEMRKNVRHLLIKKEDINSITDILKTQFSYFRKGANQRKKYEEMNSERVLLYKIAELNEYMREVMEMDNVICFLAVTDSANKYWDAVDKNVMGLESNLSIQWRRSYVAVISTGDSRKVIYEKLGDNYKEVLYQNHFADETLNCGNGEAKDYPEDNYYYVSSHAMGKNRYTKCAIVINGENYARNRRGLNIVVYSKQTGCVIDSIYVDLWADPSLQVRRD